MSIILTWLALLNVCQSPPIFRITYVKQVIDLSDYNWPISLNGAKLMYLWVFRYINFQGTLSARLGSHSHYNYVFCPTLRSLVPQHRVGYLWLTCAMFPKFYSQRTNVYSSITCLCSYNAALNFMAVQIAFMGIEILPRLTDHQH